jgi:hypothetical protein
VHRVPRSLSTAAAKRTSADPVIAEAITFREENTGTLTTIARIRAKARMRFSVVQEKTATWVVTRANHGSHEMFGMYKNGPPRFTYVSMVMGMGVHQQAIAYAKAGGGTGPDYEYDPKFVRHDRDAIRIGSLILNGHFVYGNSTDSVFIERQTLIHSFLSDPVLHTRDVAVTRRSNPDNDFSNQLGKLIRPMKLDFIMDDWVYIPVNWPLSFYGGNKWLNVIQCAKQNLLNPGCQVIIPMHLNAIENLLKSIPFDNSTECPFRRFKNAGFTPSLLTKKMLDLDPHLNPLWGATQAPRAMEAVLGPHATAVASYIATELTETLCSGERGNRMAQIRAINFTVTDGLLSQDKVLLPATDPDCAYFIVFRYKDEGERFDVGQYIPPPPHRPAVPRDPSRCDGSTA